MTDKEDSDPLEVAFTAAQGVMKDAAFNRVNPHFKSRYADRSAVGKATKPVLTEHGLNIRHRLGLVEGLGYCVITRLNHISGKYDESVWPITGSTPQQRGSDVTYGCRYNVSALCNIASEEDDDANEAEREKPVPKTKAKASADGDYEALTDLMRECSTKAELKAFVRDYTDKIDALPDSWKKDLRDEYVRLMEGLTE